MGKLEHIHFDLLHFFFFRDGKGKNVFFRSIYICPQLTIVPYVLTMEVILFRKKRFFVAVEKQVAGVFALHEEPDALNINNLAVALQFRKHGIATYAIDYADKQARVLDKKWLELSVLKNNAPALHLYRKLGFSKKKEKKQTFIMTRKPTHVN